MAKQREVRERWRERVRAQEASGLSIRGYCKEHGFCEHSFYGWRQKFRAETQPVRFALVEAKAERPESADRMAELLLPGGERLRIPCEEAALRMVLRTLRALG